MDSYDCVAPTMSPRKSLSPITRARKAKGLTLEGLAKLAGTYRQQIHKLENERPRGIDRDWALRLAPHLGVPPEDLIFEDTTVPLVARITANAEVQCYDKRRKEGAETAIMPPNGSEKTVAMEITCHDLGRHFNGWVVYCDDDKLPPSEAPLGKLCVVGLKNGKGLFVRELQRAGVTDRYHLILDHSETMFEQAVDWVSPITAILPPEVIVKRP